MDSRDLQKEIVDLEELQKETDEDIEELDELLALKEECEGYGWDYGIHFIKDDEFYDYARESAEECGLIGDDQNNPLMNYIDWQSWADAMQEDYTEIEFREVTYWFRES